MKKLISIVSIAMSALTGAYAQGDDAYYTNGNDAYAYSSYNNSSYNNGYNNDPYAASYQDYDQSYQTFYDEMAPYGRWVYDARYGRVWLPSVAAGFSPYLTNGHWVYTDYGWTWVSDYSWGWAAFHYGRWCMDDRYGWMWVPGSEWAPAWVMWGSYSNNYCWAPIAPGYGFSSYSYYRPAARYWNFVGCDHINQPYVSNYVVNHNVSVTNVTVNNITVINNYNTYNNGRFSSGPRVNDVERVTGHRIAAVSITASAKPGVARIDRNQIEMYRPTISRQATPSNIRRERTVDVNRNSVQRADNNGMQRNLGQRESGAGQIQRADMRNNAQPERMQMNAPQRAEMQRPVQNGIEQRSMQANQMQRDMRASAQPERIQMNAPQRAEAQRSMQNSAPAYQPARQNFEQRPAMQPSRESAPQQRTFSQPERQGFSQQVQRQQERGFAQAERPAQQMTRQMPEMSRVSASPQAAGRMGRR